MSTYVYHVRWTGEFADQTYCKLFANKDDAINFMISEISDDDLPRKDKKMTNEERVEFIKAKNVYPKSNSENYKNYFELEVLPLCLTFEL